MYNSIEIAVRKWGNSLGIRIPKHLAELMNVSEGTRLRLVFSKDHVEMRVSEEELAMDEHPSQNHRVRKFRVPDYSERVRGRKTPITLTDKNFEEVIAKYPFVIVLFLDYMYLDFYDRIEERFVQLKELAESYSGYVWFATAPIGKNELAREKYVGNVWGEEEVRGFVNGKMTFKSGKLEVVQEVIRRILPKEKQEIIDKRMNRSVPIIADVKNMNSILTKNNYVVAGFFPPGEKEGIQMFNELARVYRDRVTFTLTSDRVLFNETSRTFYRNPLFERYGIVEEREIILFNRGTIVKRGTSLDREALRQTIDMYLTGSKRK